MFADFLNPLWRHFAIVRAYSLLVSTNSADITHRRLFRKTMKIREKEKLTPARSRIICLLGLVPDVRQQSRQQRAMNIVRQRVFPIRLPSHLRDHRQQLLMHILPFRSRMYDRNCCLHCLRKLRMGKVFRLLAKEFPDFQIAEKIAGFINELFVRFVRNGLFFCRSLSRDPAPTTQRQ